jgi:hypothetical protein
MTIQVPSHFKPLEEKDNLEMVLNTHINSLPDLEKASTRAYAIMEKTALVTAVVLILLAVV